MKLDCEQICPHCQLGILELVIPSRPFDMEHLQCNNCNSTYTLDDIED